MLKQVQHDSHSELVSESIWEKIVKKENPFEIDFESYIREGEPDKKEKSIAWSIATGLQQVDGLTPSAYLYETEKRNIEGEISIEEAKTYRYILRIKNIPHRR